MNINQKPLFNYPADGNAWADLSEEGKVVIYIPKGHDPEAVWNCMLICALAKNGAVENYGNLFRITLEGTVLARFKAEQHAKTKKDGDFEKGEFCKTGVADLFPDASLSARWSVWHDEYKKAGNYAKDADWSFNVRRHLRIGWHPVHHQLVQNKDEIVSFVFWSNQPNNALASFDTWKESQDKLERVCYIQNKINPLHSAVEVQAIHKNCLLHLTQKA